MKKRVCKYKACGIFMQEPGECWSVLEVKIDQVLDLLDGFYLNCTLCYKSILTRNLPKGAWKIKTRRLG
jgi:hypothetical protein